MANVKLTAYHTCHLQESVKVAFNGSPYKSELNKPQWLGDGYYFWTDSDFFAHQWGRLSNKYPKGYVITQYDIQIPKDVLLDLVGNVKDQLFFHRQIIEYAKKMNVASQDIHKIPISKVLAHLRSISQNNDSRFVYQAIKVADYQDRAMERSNNKKKYSFSYPFLENGQEKLVIPSRQQLYLENLTYLKSKKLYEIWQFNGKSHISIPIKQNFEYHYLEQSND